MIQNRKPRGRRRIRIRSKIAKELETPKFRQRIVKDKRGKEHDLNKMTFRDLVEEIQDDE